MTNPSSDEYLSAFSSDAQRPSSEDELTVVQAYAAWCLAAKNAEEARCLERSAFATWLRASRRAFLQPGQS